MESINDLGRASFVYEELLQINKNDNCLLDAPWGLKPHLHTSRIPSSLNVT